MDLGIIGLPGAGKRSVFSLLTGLDPERAPTRDGLVHGTAPVRDPRIDALTEMYQPKRSRYAEFTMVLTPDIHPDTTRTASWLGPLRNVDAFLHVIRAFEADHVFHVMGSIDPKRDLDIVDMEFLLADLALVETRLERLEKDRKSRGNDAAKAREEQVLQRCRDHLEEEQSLRTLALNDDEETILRSLQFLTMKPVVAVFNVGENLHQERQRLAHLEQSLSGQGIETVFLSAAIESELAELSPEDQADFMADLELDEPASHRLSRAAYTTLGLISFFTVGPDEVRAWPIRRGASAPEAAGRIHSDLQRGFIRADTIAYDDLLRAGSEKAARAENLYRLNGKDYVVQDGDIMEIRFSV